ncbi:MAG: glycosyltransferase family A protein, partial [Coleofasciculaceae cyanobacterium]
MAELSNPFVSVIIPVFNDSERLKTCLKSLEKQTYPQESYEIIVVDNASAEDIKTVVSQFSQALVTYESKPGSYAARNQGLTLAKGKVIAFTDSDCVPAQNWIENGVAKLVSLANCGLVAGKIELFFKNPNQPTAVELHQSVEAFEQKRYVEELGFGATANLFTFKSVIEKVGIFDENLKSGGDHEWGQRVRAAGYQQVYSEETCVGHPARHSWVQLHKKVIRVTGGLYELKKRTGYPLQRLVKDLIKDIFPPRQAYTQIWSDERLIGKKQKIQVTYIMLLIRYASAWEKIRLL